jgi:hypothetical protein
LRKQTLGVLAIALVLLSSGVVFALVFTPVSNIITGSNTVANPSLTLYYIVPFPSNEIAGVPTAASFAAVNNYNAEIDNLMLMVNFTGSGVTAACVANEDCLYGSVSSTTMSTQQLQFCYSCNPTTSTGTPQFVMTAIVPALTGGLTTFDLSIVFVHSGAYNSGVSMGLSTPYP